MPAAALVSYSGSIVLQEHMQSTIKITVPVIASDIARRELRAQRMGHRLVRRTLPSTSRRPVGHLGGQL